MTLISVLGFIASLTSVSSLVPQIIKLHKTKSARDLSSLMIINLLLCSLAWTAYGFLIHATSVWVTNILMSLSSLHILFLKLKYDR